MSILVRYAPVPTSNTERYDDVVRRLGDLGALPADGFYSHVAFYGEGQLFVDEIWDSQEQFEAFGQRVLPLLDDLASSIPATRKSARSTTSSSVSRAPSRT